MNLSGWSLLVFIVVVGLLVVGVATILWKSVFFQVEQKEVAVVTWGGKFVRTAEPGLRMRVPVIQNYRKVELWVKTIPLELRGLVFGDARFVIRYKVTEGREWESLTAFQNPSEQMQLVALTTANKELAGLTFDGAREQAGSVAESISEVLTAHFGTCFTIVTVELTSINADATTSKAISDRDAADIANATALANANAAAERLRVEAEAEAQRLLIQSKAQQQAAAELETTLRQLAIVVGGMERAVNFLSFLMYLETIHTARPNHVVLPAPNADFNALGPWAAEATK